MAEKTAATAAEQTLNLVEIASSALKGSSAMEPLLASLLWYL